MRKNKKLLGIALVPCMVGSLLAGCTASSEDTNATPSETQASEGETTQASEESSAEEKPSESVPSEQGNADGSGAAFMEMLKGISDMESYSMDTSITLKQNTTIDSETTETDVTLGLKGLTDGKGNASVTISVDYEDEDDESIALHGDLLTLSKVDGQIYIDLSNLYDMAMEALGDDSAMIEQYAEAFDITMEELESLMVLGIPLGEADISAADYTKMQDAMDLIYEDMAAAIDGVDGDFMVQDGNTYTLTVNNENVLEVVDALFSAFEGNIGDIYDAYVDGMKEMDSSAVLEAALRAIVDEVVTGLENAQGVELDDAAREELEAEIKSAMEEYQVSMEEAIAELENTRDEFVDDFNAAVKEFKDAKEDTAAEIADGDASANAVLSVTSEGEKGSRKVTSELKVDVETTELSEPDVSEDADQDETLEPVEVKTKISVTVQSVVEEGTFTVSAPKEYAPLSKVVEVAYKVYMIYEEMNTDPDVEDPSVEDPSAEEDPSGEENPVGGAYTKSELEKNYGVTIGDDQILLCDTLDNDAVLIGTYEGMEWFQSGDINSMAMQFNEDTTISIAFMLYDSGFDREFYKEYVEGIQELEDNLYYVEEEDTLSLIFFGDNVTLEIDLDTYVEGLLDDFTGGDNEKFMRGLLDLCEIVPAP